MRKDAGGPAFPMPRDDVFPNTSAAGMPKPGMSLRDYFAAKAMAAMLVAGHDTDMRGHPGWRTAFALEAFRFADAMLEARDA